MPAATPLLSSPIPNRETPYMKVKASSNCARTSPQRMNRGANICLAGMQETRHRSHARMARANHIRRTKRRGYFAAFRPFRGSLPMEQVIVVFLLFFAVLAFGWFYFQRAKGRDRVEKPVEHDASGNP